MMARLDNGHENIGTMAPDGSVGEESISIRCSFCGELADAYWATADAPRLNGAPWNGVAVCRTCAGDILPVLLGDAVIASAPRGAEFAKAHLDRALEQFTSHYWRAVALAFLREAAK